jgi:hypothetical protein
VFKRYIVRPVFLIAKAHFATLQDQDLLVICNGNSQNEESVRLKHSLIKEASVCERVSE